jgi:hypothetical protein
LEIPTKKFSQLVIRNDVAVGDDTLKKTHGFPFSCAGRGLRGHGKNRGYWRGAEKCSGHGV